MPRRCDGLPRLGNHTAVRFGAGGNAVQTIISNCDTPMATNGFISLIRQNFCSNVRFVHTRRGCILRANSPTNPRRKFVSPGAGTCQTIPLRVLIGNSRTPVCNDALRSLNHCLSSPILPFSTFNALNVTHPNSSTGNKSSRFFFFLFRPRLAPTNLGLLSKHCTIFNCIIRGGRILRRLNRNSHVRSTQIITKTRGLMRPA